MSNHQNRSSKRFVPTKWTEYLVPIILGLMLLALVVTIVMVILSVLGVLPTG